MCGVNKGRKQPLTQCSPVRTGAAFTVDQEQVLNGGERHHRQGEMNGVGRIDRIVDLGERVDDLGRDAVDRAHQLPVLNLSGGVPTHGAPAHDEGLWNAKV